MSKVFSEERELLKELKRQERWWKISRWILPFVGLYLLYDAKLFNDPNLLKIVVASLLISYVFIRQNSNTTSKLLIKLYEEKIEQEFLEEEIEKFHQKTSQQLQ